MATRVPTHIATAPRTGAPKGKSTPTAATKISPQGQLTLLFEFSHQPSYTWIDPEAKKTCRPTNAPNPTHAGMNTDLPSDVIAKNNDNLVRSNRLRKQGYEALAIKTDVTDCGPRNFGHHRSVALQERKAPENPSDVNATCCRLSAVMYSIARAPTCARTSPQDAT